VDKLDCFASEGNISLFADQLRYETNPARQEKLKRLLIDEENRLGATEDRLRTIERKLTDGAELIMRMKRLIAEMKSSDRDTLSAEQTLRNFEMIQDLFERIHDMKYAEREQRRP
jgi:hypothetical protein